jgi:hypothetical protein
MEILHQPHWARVPTENQLGAGSNPHSLQRGQQPGGHTRQVSISPKLLKIKIKLKLNKRKKKRKKIKEHCVQQAQVLLSNHCVVLPWYKP